ncbi:Protein of unknown function [Pyronema omphalodes CBS 100304]|uniref:Uncharacterized protein n=1 Tax=Pyronema omphalodes (strain CBS 100304) TaxID=1076935 RepID=U4LFK6_PYROM|nr:Protein of unknown function [Pyronema omphalodes CBS 100304]
MVCPRKMPWACLVSTPLGLPRNSRQTLAVCGLSTATNTGRARRQRVEVSGSRVLNCVLSFQLRTLLSSPHHWSILHVFTSLFSRHDYFREAGPRPEGASGAFCS